MSQTGHNKALFVSSRISYMSSHWSSRSQICNSASNSDTVGAVSKNIISIQERKQL